MSRRSPRPTDDSRPDAPDTPDQEVAREWDAADDALAATEPDAPDTPAPPPATRALAAADVIPPDAGPASPAALAMLQQVCDLFGVNPSKLLKRPELASWQYTPPDRARALEAKVKIVTMGGVKITYPITPETEEILRKILGAFRVDPKTRETVALPLPDDLTLPASAVDGHPRDQRRGGGFLRRESSRG